MLCQIPLIRTASQLAWEMLHTSLFVAEARRYQQQIRNFRDVARFVNIETNALGRVKAILSFVQGSYTLWVKKTRHLTLAHNFTKYWPIYTTFTIRLSRKFVTKTYINTTPHPKRVATLPCEFCVQKIAILKEYVKQTVMQDLATQTLF